MESIPGPQKRLKIRAQMRRGMAKVLGDLHKIHINIYPGKFKYRFQKRKGKLYTSIQEKKVLMICCFILYECNSVRPLYNPVFSINLLHEKYQMLIEERSNFVAKHGSSKVATQANYFLTGEHRNFWFGTYSLLGGQFSDVP